MNAQILDMFRNIALQGIEYLLTYYPIAERREFDPSPCEALLKLENDPLNIYLPKLTKEEWMEAVLKGSADALVPNKYDIPEPPSVNYIDPQLLDAVFVPLLAFDERGYRVGYGKGYYDRFLARCAQDVVKIGFSYFSALEKIDDIDEFDIPLNFCVTPERLYEF
jgi:5-formyltetrahydrofolate cyclo-ligase